MGTTTPASCVIGFPAKHSRSPKLHGYWLDKYGINGAYRIEEVPPEAVDAFISDLAGHGYVGANVTMPHKDAAFRLSQPDEKARAIGAANTLWLDDGVLRATNTDGDGYVAVNALIDAVRLLPCRLSTHQALEFAASLHTDMLGDEECVTLDSLWVALHRPSIHEQTESQLPLTPSSDSGPEENEGYSYYMPEMTRLQFGTEVQDMSRAAALKLSSIGKRCAELEHVIRSEQVSNSKCSFYTTCQQLTFRGCLGLHSA